MSTAIDIYLNQISLTGGIPFAVTLPKQPTTVNADVMSDDELYRKILDGIKNADEGNVRDAKLAFDKFREINY